MARQQAVVGRRRWQRPKPVYTENDLGLIAEALKRAPEDIARQRIALDAAALWYRIDSGQLEADARARTRWRRGGDVRPSETELPKRPSPSALRRRLERIAAAARKLLHHLGIENSDEAPDGPADAAILAYLAGAGEDGDGSLVDIDEDAVAIATGRLGLLIEILEAARSTADLERWATRGIRVVNQVGGPQWSLTDAGDDPDGKLFARFRSRLLKELKRRGLGLRAAWVRERSKQGTKATEHAHLLLHIPAGMLHDLQLQELCERLVGCYAGKAFPSAVTVRRQGHPDIRYLLKGLAPHHHGEFGIRKDWRVSQGKIAGKRCGFTENLGPARRTRAREIQEFLGSAESTKEIDGIRELTDEPNRRG